MRGEVNSAVAFLTKLVSNSRTLDVVQLESFSSCLKNMLCSHYADHWFPEKPFKGSGYRCIRINHKMDPLLSRAGVECGLPENALHSIFPKELTMWIDPRDVSYRIGEDGSIGILYGDQCDSSSTSEDEESISSAEISDQSSPDDSRESWDSPSPIYLPNQQQQNLEFLQTCKDEVMKRLLLNNQQPSEQLGWDYLACLSS